MNEFVTSLYSYEFKATETGPLSSDEEISLLIQESLEADNEVVKPKKKKNPPMIDESLASQSNILQESLESDSEVVNPKEEEKNACDKRIVCIREQCTSGNWRAILK